MNTDSKLDQEIIRLVKKADAVTVRAVLTIAETMIAGGDDRTALESGNAILIAMGRKPLNVDDILAKMKEAGSI